MHLHNSQLVIFDLDGTLVDSVPDIAVAVDNMLQELGVPTAGEEHVRTWVGNGAAVLVKRALAYAQLPDSELECEQALTIFKRHYLAGCSQYTRLYPGVLECLQQLAQQQITMAIVTNKPIEFVPSILEALEIDHFFRLTIGGNDLPERKPSPLPLQYCMAQLGFSPEVSVMVGDSVNDIKAAKAANIPVVAVDYGYNHGRPVSAENPDIVVSSLDGVFLP